jgi:uncharacterized protein DUF5781
LPPSARPSPELEALLEDLRAAFDRVGYSIRGPVQVRTRRDMAAAATSFRSGDGFVVLVSEVVIGQATLGLLLAHELGHVQRMEAEHPSHDDDAITAASASVAPRALEHGYQRAILHHAINFTQDLYADPVSLRVARELRLVEPAQLDALIAQFANDTPSDIPDPREARWDRVEDMVGNARAIALAHLAERAHAAALASQAQERFLSQLPADIAREAPWFQALFDDLPEDTTRERFTRLLVTYVQRFVATAEGP